MVKRWFLIMALLLAGCSQTTTPNPTQTTTPNPTQTNAITIIRGYEVAIPESYQIPTWGDAYVFGSDEQIDQTLINWVQPDPYANILGRNVFISTDRLSLVEVTHASKLTDRGWELISSYGSNDFAYLIYSKLVEQTPVAITITIFQSSPTQVLVIQTLTTDIPENPTPTITDHSVTPTPVTVLPTFMVPVPVKFYALDDPEFTDTSLLLQGALHVAHVGYSSTIKQRLFTSTKSIAELEQFYDQAYPNKVKTSSIMETIEAPNVYLGYTDSHDQHGYLMKYVIIDLADQGKPYRLILATIAE